MMDAIARVTDGTTNAYPTVLANLVVALLPRSTITPKTRITVTLAKTELGSGSREMRPSKAQS